MVHGRPLILFKGEVLKKARNVMENAMRLSEPSAGKTVWTSLLKWTIPVASSYRKMISSADSGVKRRVHARYVKTYLPFLPVGQSHPPDEEEVIRLASSALLLTWMIHRRVSNSISSFRDSETWLLGDQVSNNGLSFASNHWPPETALSEISELNYNSEFDDVLPYVAEIFETRKANLATNRHIKRDIGLYYTPSDVTEYMVRTVFDSWLGSGKSLADIMCLDPASGSGVFLRCLLNLLSNSPAFEDAGKLEVASRLYGFDASWQAIQSCAFTLFFDCANDIQQRNLNPWLAWQSIRSNLAMVDSTRIRGVGSSDAEASSANAKVRREARTMIARGERPDDPTVGKRVLNTTYTRFLGDIFGEVERGFSIIVGNPPYSGSIANGRQVTLDGRLHTGRQLGYYIPFVRMMWRFADSSYSTSAMVLPLSIAYHSGADFRELRMDIQRSRGNWRFQFFDRTPDSLFGDLIKTRNCVVFAELGQAPRNRLRIITTPLIRWNSRNRKKLFGSIPSVSLGNFSIERCIPKLGSEMEFGVYEKLRSQALTVGSMLKVTDVPKHRSESEIVYFYSTAYNWLPIFRHLPREYVAAESEFRAHSIECPDSQQADFLFGLLSSRVAYWLWRVDGDGFHLNSGFLLNLPVHPSLLSSDRYTKIAKLGRNLWNAIQHYPVRKFNAGKLSISYRPYACGDILDRLDMIVIQAFEISESFGALLREYVADTVVAGRDDEPKLRPIVQQLAGEEK
jgi:hypothetical protein